MISSGQMEYSGFVLADVLFRLLFLTSFSWCVLQLCANLAYSRVQWRPLLRYSTLILLGIGFMILVLHLWEFLHDLLFGDNERTNEDTRYLHFRYSILLLVLFFIARILRLQADQQESQLENERLKQQNLHSELAAIRNQVDPHFLFNSLNSLTSLVRGNEPATLFVKKLSHMYRYILQSSDTELVPLSEELKFLESYIYLMKTRYRDRFSVEIEIDPELYSESIPPLALQILVENAVKHNEISESHPLKVRIFSRGHTLYVENQIRPRTTLPDQTGYGLNNLEKRFGLIKKTQISIQKDGDTFSVALPLKKNA
jgi:LytS/YehU family sensor histidine kinase